ncbi:MAG TPA: TetR/AcrR family transcriptional regulator C-terminal domain-containing protein [Anaeromyxobacter sp.]|nr:TetR/AcrR family transcriptional regulator C-terminal domain-containing protein [Anaeromyxobacter sp.]
MSFLTYREGRRPAERRERLSAERVVKAALELLDEVGLDELTMRRLAERLGVKAASLYKHVRHKEELLVLLADEISGAVASPRAQGGWKAQLLDLARSYRRGLLAHRDAARVLAETAPAGPRRLRQIETVLAILRAARLGGRDAARAAYHLNNFVTEFVADEERYRRAASAFGSRRKMFAEARRYFASLPPAEFPSLVALADHLSEDDPDGNFEFGLQVWIRGIERLRPG